MVYVADNGDNAFGTFPLQECQGDCDNDGDCSPPLYCFLRDSLEPVPNCSGQGETGKDYCALPDPTPSPTPNPTPTYGPDAFIPGELTKDCDDGELLLSTVSCIALFLKIHFCCSLSSLLMYQDIAHILLSFSLTPKGMSCRRIATEGERVQYNDGSGGRSSVNMHSRADGAGVILDTSSSNAGGWFYVSNSEKNSVGGVGAFRFNANGEVINYEMILEGTNLNCGGGLTWWNTWVSCEENEPDGFCWEVDPNSGYTKKVKNVPVGGNYESFAYYKEPVGDGTFIARFYTTEDAWTGPLTRYTPTQSALNTGDNYDILDSAGGSYDYVVLNDDRTFTWSSDRDVGPGDINSEGYFPKAEGINVYNGILNFVSKEEKMLFTLDLEQETWTKSSTNSGLFDGQPDQLARTFGSSSTFLFFCEDAKETGNDLHGRNMNTGEYFTLIQGAGSIIRTLETT